MAESTEVQIEPRSSRQENFHPRSKANIFRQFRALFLKDLTLQWRAWPTNLCQLLTPIIFIVFVGLIQVIVNNMIHSKNPPVPGTEATYPPVNPGQLLACEPRNDLDYPFHPGHCNKGVFSIFSDLPKGWQDVLANWSKNVSQLNPRNVSIVDIMEFFEAKSSESCQMELFDLPFFYIGASGDVWSSNLMGNVSFMNGSKSSLKRSGLIGNMVSKNNFFMFPLNLSSNFSDQDEMCPVPQDRFITLPLFWNISNREALNHHLDDIVHSYNGMASLSSQSSDQYGRTYYVTPLSKKQYETVIGYINNQPHDLDKVKPQAGIFVDWFHEFGSSVDIHYSIVADNLALYRFGVNKTKFKELTGFEMKHLSVDVQKRSAVVNMVHNAILRHLLNQSEEEEPGDQLIKTYIMPIPTTTPQNITVDVASIVGGILYPFAASFLIPVFMSSIVKDKYEKHLIMMEQNGLSRLTYWLVTYTFHFLLYIPIAIEIAVFSLIFRVRLFTQTNSLVLIVTFFVWGHAEVVLGFFLANFFGRPRTATIVGYVLVIAGVIVALLLESLKVFPDDKTPFAVYMMYPPFAFYRILDYCITACLSMRCYNVHTLGSINLVTTAIFYLIGSTVVLMVLSVYLSYVLPSEYGVRRSPFFPIIAVYKFIKKLSNGGSGKRSKNRELARSPLHTGSEVEDEEEEEEVDIDVKEEEDSIKDHFPETAPMVMYQLRKEYPGSGGMPYVAVDSMSLAIERNECFGLLGPNGAGKTTLISVLTGLYEPTSGVARIAGYDLATEISDIHYHLGVCPQFDIQHADLTTEEHLLFYARLKGVKRSREKAVVNNALEQVNLLAARKKKSKNLSGGMRRRLSVAMAVIGNPDILFLDEPTTGLDPASKRQVQDVVQKVKKGRSVILTTHEMEEADYLCTRIGIMNFGKLRCLGSQTRLKARFGSGYQLTFNCAPGLVGQVEGFVQTNLPFAVHVETYADTCIFKMEKEHLKVSELFPLINREKTRLGILDWGVKMTTLEDVFLKIVQQHSDHRTRISHSILPAWLPCQHCLQRQKQQVDE